MWGALGGKGGEPAPKVQHHKQRWRQERGLEGECTCLWSPGSGLPRAGECRGCPRSEIPTVAEDPVRGRTEGRGPARHFRWKGTRTVSIEEQECSEGPGKSSYPQKSLLAELTRLATFDEGAAALAGRARSAKGSPCKRTRVAGEGARTLASRARSAKEWSPRAAAHDGEDSKTVAGRAWSTRVEPSETTPSALQTQEYAVPPGSPHNEERTPSSRPSPRASSPTVPVRPVALDVDSKTVAE